MVTDAFGILEQSFTISQWRGQIGYCLSAQNEIGVWGTLRDQSSEKSLFRTETYGYRPLNQIALFWHHTYCCGANSWFYVGMPERVHTTVGGELDGGGGLGQSLAGPAGVSDGSLGEFTLGATFTVPISCCWALYANASYMRPTASAGDYADVEAAYSVGFGLTFYPGANAHTRTVAGNCWMPYLPVANNGSFLVDSPSRL
jgi:hypothetical protein